MEGRRKESEGRKGEKDEKEGGGGGGRVGERDPFFPSISLPPLLPQSPSSLSPSLHPFLLCSLPPHPLILPPLSKNGVTERGEVGGEK